MSIDGGTQTPKRGGLRSGRPGPVLLLALLVTALGTIAITFGPSMVATVNGWQERTASRRSEEQFGPHREFYRLTETAQQGSHSTDPAVIRASVVPAQRCLVLASQFSTDWNYGNAVHYGNLALGRSALLNGDVVEARQRLLAAGRTPGSPQLGDQGPDMTLAQELLARGEQEVVLAYLGLCDHFWIRKEKNRVHEWTEALRTGHAPEFGKRSGLAPGR